MRKINGKLFLALLVGGVVLTGTVFVVHHFQYKRIGRALHFQAKHAEEKGQPREHARYLERYLEFHPRDLEAKIELAKLWAGDGFPPKKRRQAVSLLDEVLIHSGDPKLRLLLIETAMQFPDQASQKIARDHLEKLLPLRELESWIAADLSFRNKNVALPENMAKLDPQRGRLEGFWGQLLEADKKQPEAMHCFRLAVRHAPEELHNYMRLAYLLRRATTTSDSDRSKNVIEANRALDDVVKNNPASHESYLSRWRYRRDFSLIALSDNPLRIKLEVAAEDVAEAIKRRPESIEVLLAAADLERLRGRAAASALTKTPVERREGLKTHRDRAEAHLARGLDIVAKNSAATSEYGRFQLLWHQGNLLLDDLDVARSQAEEDNQRVAEFARLESEINSVVEQVRKSHVPAAADYMRGRLLVHKREWPEAARLLQKARALMNDQAELVCQADLYLGQCYERLEEHAQMQKSYRDVLNRDPNSLQAQLGIAQALHLSGDLAGALKQYRTIMDQKLVPPRGWFDIARLEIARHAQGETLNWTAIDQAVKNAKLLNKDTAKVEIALLEAEVLVRKAIAAGKSKFDDARAVLEAASQGDPTEADLHAALVDIALREKDEKAANSALAHGRREAGDKVALRLAEARLLAAQAGSKANAKILALAKTGKGTKDEEESRLLNGLAEVLVQNQAVPQARELWQKMASLKRERSNLRLRLLLFDLAMREADEKGMVAVLDEIQNIEQDSSVYRRYGDALLHIWKARRTTDASERADLLAKATADLDRVKNLRRAWAPVFIAQAEVAELKGLIPQAIKQLQEARATGDKSPATVRKLVALHTGQGDEAEAQKLLDSMRPEMLRQNDLAKIRVLIELQKDRGKALDLLRNAVRDGSSDPKDLLFEARVLSKEGSKRDELDQAEKLFDRALTEAPTDPVPYVAKVQFLVEQKRQKEVPAVIARLEKQVPADRASLALGRCYDLIGQPQKAESWYKQAVAEGDPATLRAVAAAHLERGRALLAEPILKEMVTGKMKNVTSADVTWAQRALALTLAGGTDFSRFTEALALVGLKLDGNGKLLGSGDREEPTDSIRTRARVLATQNQKQFRTEAIRLLEGLRKQNALTPDDQYILSGLYEQQGENQRAKETLAELVARRETRNPQYLAQYAMVLIAQRNFTEAEKYVNMLADLESKNARDPNTWASIELRARLLEGKGQGNDAVKLLNAHIARDGAQPEEVLLVLSSLGRQKKFAEAFALCEETWKKAACQPEAVGAVSVQLIQVWDKVSDAQIAAVEKHLTAALAKKKESVVLRLHLATLYDKRGQYDLALEQYRAVLAKESNNFVALNNLAWLLALRSTEAHKALDHIDRAIAGMGRRADLLDTRALVHLAMKEPAKAIADLTEAVQDSPTPSRLFHLARAHHENRDEGKAREFLKRAREKKLDVASLHPIEQAEAKKLLAEYR